MDWIKANRQMASNFSVMRSLSFWAPEEISRISFQESLSIVVGRPKAAVPLVEMKLWRQVETQFSPRPTAPQHPPSNVTHPAPVPWEEACTEGAQKKAEAGNE